MPAWIIIITWLTRLILILLVVLSIWSISIILDRLKTFKREDSENMDEALEHLKSKKIEALQGWSNIGLRGQVVKTLAFKTGAKSEKLDRSVKSLIAQKRVQLEKGLTVLGSLGSNAPFIGLFGTVLGIIQAFGVLSYEQGNMQVVMLAIAEALIATAVGLFVAVPAVLAYNYFARKIRLIVNDCESFKDQFVATYGES